ncbi:MAG TPA: DUF3817 domain-containing protein [Mycobacteriales bacterium]|nr:DUF3817 domain-containing protein [Mycobacteriales bacterium]
MSAALTRYRVLAYVVGTGLVILVCVGVPLRYAGGNKIVVEIVGPLHGFLFIAYLLAAIDLAIRCRWHPVRALLVMAAGTVPFCSFLAERVVTRDVRARLAAGVSSPRAPRTG